MSETVLEEAERLVAGDRQKLYGPPVENFKRIAGLWSAYLAAPVTEQDVCSMMILLKQARVKTGGGYHRDSAVDAAGYSRLQEMLSETAKPLVLEDGATTAVVATPVEIDDGTINHAASTEWNSGATTTEVA